MPFDLCPFTGGMSIGPSHSSPRWPDPPPLLRILFVGTVGCWENQSVSHIVIFLSLSLSLIFFHMPFHCFLIMQSSNSLSLSLSFFFSFSLFHSPFQFLSDQQECTEISDVILYYSGEQEVVSISFLYITTRIHTHRNKDLTSIL